MNNPDNSENPDTKNFPFWFRLARVGMSYIPEWFSMVRRQCCAVILQKAADFVKRKTCSRLFF
jgi:hypothetical protein